MLTSKLFQPMKEAFINRAESFLQLMNKVDRQAKLFSLDDIITAQIDEPGQKNCIFRVLQAIPAVKPATGKQVPETIVPGTELQGGST